MRLFFLIVFCMTAVLLLISVLVYNRTIAQYHQRLNDITQKNVSQTDALFDLLLRGYDSLSKSISSNMDLIRLLQEKPDNAAIDFINERTITNMIGAIYYSREDLIGIHVMNFNGKIYNYGNAMSAIDTDYAASDWFSMIRAAAGKMSWIGVSAQSVIDRAETRPVFAFGRLIYDLNEHTPIGIVLIEVEPQSILDAMANLKLSDHTEIYVESDQGSILASTEPNVTEIPKPLQGLPAPGSDQDIFTQDTDGHLVIVSKLPFGGWTITSRTPDADVNAELNQTRRFLFVVVAALIAFSAFIASLVARSISSPLKRMIREMKKVESGNFNGMLDISSYKEINQLTASFNRMVGRISELIERVKISSVSEKNAELHALQSQVNPHFLYNTLDMIYWMMDEKGDERLGEVILSLSAMFRYSSNWEDGMEVTLREEVEQIGHYLRIILTRLDNRLQVEIDIDPRWMDIKLPKMTLQPIIENAVKHGLEPLKRPGELKVFAERDASHLNLVVRDNGVGMTEEQLCSLTESVNGGGKQSGKGRRGIGMQNLNRRWQHMYGEAYSLQVKSSPDEGTSVILPLPLPMEGEQ
ncbi:sensor histidine kinase [Cohnella sp. CBP 2801]|uniref:histidine kinase n=2 Tax=Cohnella zeiphila TaxID=2761120 RepID=A0A7X0SNA7_9BACL|nr:sensor histidine kinase [Cohnella zeiphila]MBB6733145.1 sensor histidine kinase [Cohnella zeiphila]